MKSIAVLSNLLHHLYRGIQCDKTHNFVHGETFEVQHEIYRFRRGFKRHTESITNLQFPSKFLRMSPKLHFDDSVNICKLLDRKYYNLCPV